VFPKASLKTNWLRKKKNAKINPIDGASEEGDRGRGKKDTYAR
jgi:hypothetical protein